MRRYLRFVGLMVLIFVGLVACDLFGDDDDEATWGGLGPGFLGDTLSIDVPITLEVQFDQQGNATLITYEHQTGRDFSLVIDELGPVEVDTDTDDNATLTLTAGVPDASALVTPTQKFDPGVTSTNADARIGEAEIRSSDFFEVQFTTTDVMGTFYSERYLYSSEATVLGGTIPAETADDVDRVFSDVSLAAGWNVVIFQSGSDGEIYTNSTPPVSGAWIFGF